MSSLDRPEGTVAPARSLGVLCLAAAALGAAAVAFLPLPDSAPESVIGAGPEPTTVAS